MTQVTIQQNTFNCRPIADTQEDNFAGIKNRFDLFHIYHNQNNGNQSATLVGRLVQYFDNTYAVFHGSIRYDFKSGVSFT